MKTSYDIIKTLLRTEKSAGFEDKGKYLFLVDKSANKVEIKHAVEEIYKVKVTDVNTVVMPGKLKRVRYQYGRTPDFKKAFVKLAEGQKIEAAP